MIIFAVMTKMTIIDVMAVMIGGMVIMAEMALIGMVLTRGLCCDGCDVLVFLNFRTINIDHNYKE